MRRIEAKFGHTEPWIVLCEGADGLVAFVVKVFKEHHLREKPRVHGEFIGTWAAGEFDLLTPDVAWIKFDQTFILSLPKEISGSVDLDDDRLKFGSRVLGPIQHFSTGMPKGKFQKLIQLDTLYAFDNLIRNPDRGSHKPNLLLREDSAYVIDHEYALEIDVDTLSHFENLDIAGKFSTSHITFPYLSSSKENVKRNYFDMFLEYLRAFNLEDLEAVLREVTNEGYEAQLKPILEYFRFVKGNPSIFVTALKRTLP